MSELYLRAADLSLERQWRELLGEGFHRRPREETGGSADLTDDDFFGAWKRLSNVSNAEFAEARRGLVARHPNLAAQPSADLTDDELDDEEFWRYYEDLKSGEVGRRQARRNVAEAAREREDYWRHAYRERDEPLPRDLQEDLAT